MFDLSTFGKVDVSGSDATRFLDRICSNHMRIPTGRATYTLMLNERGGVESDLVAVRLEENRFRLTTGTAALIRDKAWLSRWMDDYDVSLEDRTGSLAILGLMGPGAARIAGILGAGVLNDLPRFHALSLSIADIPVYATRLSYVGEPGWELTCANEDATDLFDLLLEAGAAPAGSLAQSAMRIEAGYLAHGHDMDTDTTPLEVNLGFAVAWDTDFVGRDALMMQKRNGTTNRLVSLLFDPDEDIVPLGNEPVSLDGELVGKTTSAAWGLSDWPAGRVGGHPSFHRASTGIDRDGEYRWHRTPGHGCRGRGHGGGTAGRRTITGAGGRGDT